MPGTCVSTARACKASLRLRAGEPSRSCVQLDVPREGPAPQDIPLDDPARRRCDRRRQQAGRHDRASGQGALGRHAGQRARPPLRHAQRRGGPTRPGIVHRLDRDTSGVIVVAKNDQAHDALAAQFKSRRWKRSIWRSSRACPNCDRDVIDEPIGDHPTHREKKAIRRQAIARAAGGDAVRSRRAIRRLCARACTPEDGPHAPDSAAPGPRRLPGAVRPAVRRPEPEEDHRTGIDPARQNRAGYAGGGATLAEPLLERQALHAHRLAIDHPTTGERMTVRGARCRPTWNAHSTALATMAAQATQ